MNDHEPVADLKKVLEAAGYETCTPEHASPENKESRCLFCGSIDELRFDVCFACADAQSIIGMGTDMYDHGEGGTRLPAKESNARLRLLIKAGWRFVPAAKERIDPRYQFPPHHSRNSLEEPNH